MREKCYDCGKRHLSIHGDSRTRLVLHIYKLHEDGTETPLLCDCHGYSKNLWQSKGWSKPYMTFRCGKCMNETRLKEGGYKGRHVVCFV